MNWTQIEANWDQFKGKLRSKWGKLTDDDLENIKGKKDLLFGKLKERYALEKDKAEKEVDSWLKMLDRPPDRQP
jgi:uncharacterized protein YjbJ (UPF0337 family)